MSDEAQIHQSLTIVKGNLEYQSRPTAYKADVSGTKGPTPGAIEATLAGVNVDLSALDTPGWCFIQNIDSTNYVEYGIWDSDNSKFFPLGELLAGECVVLRLSRDIQEEYGTGTGTTGTAANYLRVKADTAACNVVINAFEK